MKIILIGFVFCCAFQYCYNFKIVGIIHAEFKSHFKFASALLKGLAERGHDVTVISPLARKTSMSNYENITTTIPEGTRGAYENISNMTKMRPIQIFLDYVKVSVSATKATLEDANVQHFVKQEKDADVVLIDLVLNEALLGIAYELNAPVIGLSPMVATLCLSDMMGAPSPSSHVPNIYHGLPPKMNIWQRIGNMIGQTIERFCFHFISFSAQEQIYENHFPNPKPTLDQLWRNVSLLLVNSHFSVSLPRPTLPNIIEVGGLHINTKPNPIPDYLKQYLDDAKHGVIYFSMGSVLKSRFIEQDKLESIMEIFKTLKQKVLWKFEEKNLTGKSDNVFISDWFPQEDILSHPNVKLFITHGGRLSTLEAIYHGVPMVGIPAFADQLANVAAISQAGIGVALQYNTFTKDDFKYAINEVLNNEKYKRNMKEFSRRFRDQPMSPLDTAVYWVEYVARHKGAPHLHSAGQELSFIQYNNIDAIVLLITVLLVILYLFIALVKKTLRLVCLKTNNEQKCEKKLKIA